MSETQYDRAEAAELKRALGRGEARPACPRCGVAMSRRRVPPRSGVAYVRDRIWLVCLECRRSLVVDRRALDET